MQVRTDRRRQFVDITAEVGARVPRDFTGAVLMRVPHTTAAVTVNEGFDPDVIADILSLCDRIVPRNMPQLHSEGNSDSHALCSLIGDTALVPARQGQLLLGRWQRIFLCEFDGPRSRQVSIMLLPGKDVSELPVR